MPKNSSLILFFEPHSYKLTFLHFNKFFFKIKLQTEPNCGIFFGYMLGYSVRVNAPENAAYVARRTASPGYEHRARPGVSLFGVVGRPSRDAKERGVGLIFFLFCPLNGSICCLIRCKTMDKASSIVGGCGGG